MPPALDPLGTPGCQCSCTALAAQKLLIPSPSPYSRDHGTLHPERKGHSENERKTCHALRRTFLKIPDHMLSHHSPECALRLRVVSVDNFEAFFNHWLTYRP